MNFLEAADFFNTLKPLVYLFKKDGPPIVFKICTKIGEIDFLCPVFYGVN